MNNNSITCLTATAGLLEDHNGSASK